MGKIGVHEANEESCEETRGEADPTLDEAGNGATLVWEVLDHGTKNHPSDHGRPHELEHAQS